ncbi:hypothetical protein [Haloferula sp.]|uniref:hypothetical protein n=1 Tax=Haloferula sp. TaxID=2497595 RepID=UPI003C76EB6C
MAKRVRIANRDTWPVDESSKSLPSDWSGWPEGKRFALVVTHDIESEEGLSKVRKLAELEQVFGFRSSYCFVPEGDYRVSEDLRSWLVDSGFEVGVHDLKHDGRLYESRTNFPNKAKRINSYLKEWNASGFRSAFMLRRLTWLHELEIKYDSSTFDTDPFEPQPNGCGTIFPFFISSSDEQKDEGYVELPYTLPQDSTIFLLLREESPDIWIKKLDWIAENGGMALINIHPDYIDFECKGETDSYHYPVRFIEEFLTHIEDRYAGEYWNPLAKDLAEWFQAKRSTGKINASNPRSRGLQEINS